MRLLHTADWHLGRKLHNVDLLPDQAAILDQIAGYCVSEAPNALILAGDVFDRTTPPREALTVFSEFLRRMMLDTSMAIIVIAGNHDAAELVDLCGLLQVPDRFLIRGPLASHRRPLVLEDEAGAVAISALPYADTFQARHYFHSQLAADTPPPVIKTPEHVLHHQIAEARRQVPDNCRWIITAHGFVAGGMTSDSERPLDFVGGLETVSPAQFEGAHYVALGHLHRRQNVAGQSHIHYSGSILPFGFDEAHIDKSITLVDMAADGHVTRHTLALEQPHPLRVLSGRFDELTATPSPPPADMPTNARVQIRLLDKLFIPDAADRLRQYYPNLIHLEWPQLQAMADAANPKAPRAEDQISQNADPATLIRRYFEDVTETTLADDQIERLRQIFHQSSQQEA